MKKFLIPLGVSLFLPFIALAQVGTNPVTDINDFFLRIIDIINGILVPLVFAVALIVFIWGVFQYFVAGASDEEKRENGKSLMIYGLIAFFVMASVWGIVNVLVGTFGLDTDIQFNFPDADAINR